MRFAGRIQLRQASREGQHVNKEDNINVMPMPTYANHCVYQYERGVTDEPSR